MDQPVRPGAQQLEGVAAAGDEVGGEAAGPPGARLPGVRLAGGARAGRRPVQAHRVEVVGPHLGPVARVAAQVLQADAPVDDQMLAYGEEAHRLREPAGHLLGRALDPAGVPVVRAAVLGEQGPVRGPGTVVHGRGVPGDHLIDGKPVQYGRRLAHALCHRPSLGHAAREAKSRAAVYEAVWGGERGPVGPLSRPGGARPVCTGPIRAEAGGSPGRAGRRWEARWSAGAGGVVQQGTTATAPGACVTVVWATGDSPSPSDSPPSAAQSPSGRPSPTRPPGSATRSR
ncbi:hypothetical protein SCALM49S_05628 [Streptomyces californicus]